MPFDSKNFPAEVELDLSKLTLKNLSWVLRHREAWPPGQRWDYSQAPTCAIGLAASRWPNDLRSFDINLLGDNLNLSRTMTHKFFNVGAYAPVTARIDAYLGRRRS